MLPLAFFLSLTCLWFQATLYAGLPISPFVPFLALTALLAPFRKALWLAALAGLCTDLLTSDPLGLSALGSCASMALCYSWRNRFSAEIPLQFSLYTALFSAISSFLQIALLFLFDRRVPFDGKWWMMQWACFPIADAIYAFVWFAGPLILYRTFRRTWVIYWLKKKDPSTP
ncbi:MAG: hypothetical protein KGJ02_06525 [Verrucomicrobiota bacterium]|nr:hypothetical protein [Verrucomicrobiota bacterium]